MSKKLLGSTLNLKQFLLRQEVLKQYKTVLKTIRRIPDESNRKELTEWARKDYKDNKYHTDEQIIKMMLKHGEKCLKDLKTNLMLSGNM